MIAIAYALLLSSSFASDRGQIVRDCDRQSAELRVREFYEGYVVERDSGLPDDRDINKWQGYMSGPLRLALAQARADQEAFALQRPEEKPPLVEGSLFSHVSEGPDHVEVDGVALLRPGLALVTLRMEVRGGSASREAWTDSVVLTCENAWKIDDVIYRDVGEGPAQGLRALLRGEQLTRHVEPYLPHGPSGSASPE